MVVNVADAWLYSKLSGDATLTGLVGGRIYGHIAPQEASYPLVLFALQTADDVQTLGPHRIMSNMLYVVRVVGEASSFGAPLSSVADRIDAVLQAASGTAGAGRVLACVRENPSAMVESNKGKQYRYLGGVYRLYAQ